jgi:two-component system, chemotaxis family, protein-glutamate methylesterase/glutaminase
MNARANNHRSPIEAVVIGGSAGALNVVRELLRALDTPARAPVVVVFHLPPRSPDGLAELLSRECAFRVKQAEDKEPLEAGTVYLAPPGYHLLIESHRAFALSVDAPVHFSRPSIDVLFESAADAYGSGLLAVLLSGASADGAAGLQEVSAAGGMTVVQAPSSAESETMPNAALHLFKPTFIWTPEELARELPRMIRDSEMAGTGTSSEGAA